jgi:hypothetical protein
MSPELERVIRAWGCKANHSNIECDVDFFARSTGNKRNCDKSHNKAIFQSVNSVLTLVHPKVRREDVTILIHKY